MIDWLEGFDRVPGNDSGSWARGDTVGAKLLAHTTEGGSTEGAISAYRAHNSWPHITADPVRRRRAQHVPLSRPARALRNGSTPGETNRDRFVYQVEIVGFAGRSHLWRADDVEWLGTHVFGPLARAVRAPLTTSVRFYGEDAGFALARVDARQRLPRAAWDAYAGLLGHQHAPENTHWDPGKLDAGRLLAAARGTTPTPSPEGDLTVADAKAIMAKLDTMGGQLADLLVSTPKKAAPVRGPDGRVWVIGDEGRWHVPDRETLDTLIYLGQVHGYGSKGIAEVTEDFLDGIPVLP